MTDGVCFPCAIVKVLRVFSILDVILALGGIVGFVIVWKDHLHFELKVTENRTETVAYYHGHEEYSDDEIDICFQTYRDVSPEVLNGTFHAVMAGFVIALLGYIILGVHLFRVTLKPKRVTCRNNLILQAVSTAIIVTCCILFNLPMLCELDHYRGFIKTSPFDLQGCIAYTTAAAVLAFKLLEVLNIRFLHKCLVDETFSMNTPRHIQPENLFYEPSIAFEADTHVRYQRNGKRQHKHK